MSGEGILAASPPVPDYVRPMTALESSCFICFGASVWGDQAYACHCRAAIEPATVRKVLMLLTVPQMAFLRAFEHTLASQAVTKEEYEAHQVEFWVEDDDAVHDGYELLIPASKIWFAGGQHSMGPQHDGIKSWIHYNPLGLALRECLMAGASASCR